MSPVDPAARRRLYAFFSRLWVKELDDAFVEVLRGPLGRELLPRFAESADAKLLAPAEQRQATFDADFAHLTVVNLVPYESFYRREDGLLEAGAVNPVAVFSRKYGFEVDLASARSLAPDHLGIELEFLSVLCAKEQEAAEQGNRPYAGVVRGVERDFLREHLLAWAPVYLFAARRNAKTVLYREAAEVTAQFVLGDLEALS